LGFAHIGANQYLEEHHIPIYMVVGTSKGGLVGGLFATGRSPAEIRQLTEEIDWNAVLGGRTAFQELSFRRKEDRVDFPNRLEFGLKGARFNAPAGLNSGHQAGLVFDQATLAYENPINFDDLPIPFRCVATDMTAGKEKVFDSGSLPLALRATMSIPAVFAPVTIDGHVYTDGGAVDNLPVDVAKQTGADIVIAVYLDTGPVNPNTYNSLLNVAARNISIMISANEMRNMQAADVLISADLKGFTSSAFTQAKDIIPKGYEAAQKKQRLLAAFSLNDEDWKAYVAARDAKIRRRIPVPQFLDVVGAKRDYNETLRENLAQFIGKPIDVPQLEQTLTKVTGTGSIAAAGYSIVGRNGTPGLAVRTYEKSYGPPFLDLAVNIDGSEPDNVLFGMAARLTFLDFGAYRAEWRSEAFFGSTYGVRSEYYRPFSHKNNFFYAPHVYALSSPFDLYLEQSRLAKYRIERTGFGIDAGYNITPRSEIRVGQDLLWYRTRKIITSDTFPDSSERDGISTLQYRYFGMDNVELPRKGFDLQWSLERYERSDEFSNFTQSELRARYFQPVSKTGSLLFTASGGTTFGTPTLDVLLQGFSLGGPFRLGAYGLNELLGNQYFLFQGGYEHKLISFSPLAGEGLYAMGLFEVGKMYDSFNFGPSLPYDGSFLLAARTAIGPVFMGGSIGNASHRKWWFGVGRIF
jgi:NTE family protein